MNRRDLVKSLFAAPAALVLPRLTWPDTLPPTAPDAPFAEEHAHDFLDYRIRWTGWKGSIENAYVVGQWLGWPLRGYGQWDVPDRQPYFYVSVPGFAGGIYRAGYVFDLTHHGHVVDASTPEEQRQAWLAEGLVYLRGLIATFGRGPARPGHCPVFHFPVAPDDFARALAYYEKPDEPEYQFGFTGFKPAGDGRAVYRPGAPFVLR